MARNIVEHPLSPDLTDQCLLERCSAGDQRAFEMLVQRYQGSLSLFVSKYLGHEEALDVVQGILLQLYLSLPTLHRNPSLPRNLSSLRSWLYRVAWSRCVDTLRKRKREVVMWGGVEHLKGEEGESLLSAIPDPAPSPEELVERAEEQHRLYALIQQLPPKQRAVVWLRDAEGLSFQEIAHHLQISAATARTTCQRGRMRLRAALSETRA